MTHSHILIDSSLVHAYILLAVYSFLDDVCVMRNSRRRHFCIYGISSPVDGGMSPSTSAVLHCQECIQIAVKQSDVHRIR